jgi:hypothetical protein
VTLKRPTRRLEASIGLGSAAPGNVWVGGGVVVVVVDVDVDVVVVDVLVEEEDVVVVVVIGYGTTPHAKLPPVWKHCELWPEHG